jgi:hypothetical protein
MGFSEVDDFPDGFAVFDICEEGGGWEVPPADYVLAL